MTVYGSATWSGRVKWRMSITHMGQKGTAAQGAESKSLAEKLKNWKVNNIKNQ